MVQPEDGVETSGFECEHVAAHLAVDTVVWGYFERPHRGVRILGEVVESRLAARESAGSGEGERRECLRQPYYLRRHGRAVVHGTGGVAQRIRGDAVGKGQVEERFG